MSISGLDYSKATVLVIEDEATQNRMLTAQLTKEGYKVLSAENGRDGLFLWEEHPDIRIVITDISMPVMDGYEVVEYIRRHETHYTYILVLTGLAGRDSLEKALSLGADDYVSKPIYKQELLLRLQGASRLLRMEGQDSLVFAMAELAGYRSGETGLHLTRVKEYSRLVADDLRIHQPERGITRALVEDIAMVSPLHDIGKVGIPDHILHKPGKLSAEEFEIMKTHPVLGGKVLRELYEENWSSFLLLAYEVAMGHHEKWDGSGYPRGLKGEEIPLSARIVALADVFDALTSTRCYKEAFSFDRAKSIIMNGRGVQFDPMLVDSCLRLETQMLEIQSRLQDTGEDIF